LPRLRPCRNEMLATTVHGRVDTGWIIVLPVTQSIPQPRLKFCLTVIMSAYAINRQNPLYSSRASSIRHHAATKHAFVEISPDYPPKFTIWFYNCFGHCASLHCIPSLTANYLSPLPATTLFRIIIRRHGIRLSRLYIGRDCRQYFISLQPTRAILPPHSITLCTLLFFMSYFEHYYIPQPLNCAWFHLPVARGATSSYSGNLFSNSFPVLHYYYLWKSIRSR